MKHLLFIAAAALLAASCDPVIYPMPGMNYDNISNIKTAKPYDSVWAQVNRLFVNEGYVLKVSDKDSGLIVTEKYDFGKRFSFVKNKKPIDSTAWVALSYTTNKGGFGNNPFRVYAHWTVKIKHDGTGCAIRIDLSKVDASVTKPAKSMYHPDQIYTFQGQSTGVFEKMLNPLSPKGETMHLALERLFGNSTRI